MDRAMIITPLSLLELNLNHAIVSILNKPQWHNKWQDPVVRAKWLSEIRAGFISKIYDECLQWSKAYDIPTFNHLIDLIYKPYSAEKEAEAQEWSLFVRYELMYYVGKYKRELPGVPGSEGSAVEYSELWGKDADLESEEEEDEDEEEEDKDEEDKDEEDEDEEERERQNSQQNSFARYGDYLYDYRPKMNPYVYIQWYLAMAKLHQQIFAVPVQQWDVESIVPLIQAAKQRTDPQVRADFVNFIELTKKQPDITDEDIQVALGSYKEVRPKVLNYLRRRSKLIHDELANCEKYIMEAIDTYAAHRIPIGTDVPTHVSPTGIFSTWTSDDAIPDSLKSKFLSEVAALEDIPDDLKDWHPNTNKQVLDLVHPSLYCCVFGRTKRVPAPLQLDSFKDPTQQMTQIVFAASEDIERPNLNRYDGIKTQWIPSDFQVREDGSVRILSYINNLHPGQHAPMYASIEEIFSRFVPMFECSLSNAKQGSIRQTLEVPQTDLIGEIRPKFPDATFSFEDFNYSSADSSKTVKLGGRTVQVIVKIAEIVLTPDAPRYEGGSWHIEGTHHEQIVATGIYYFGCKNIKDSRLSFRVLTDPPQYDQNDDAGVAIMYGIANESHLVQALGSVNTLEDRCLVFPNGLQHKVEPFELEDPTKSGVRKILAFFLVDPEQTILSTSVIPPQQQDWIDSVEAPVLKKLRLVDTAVATVREMLASNTMSRQEAEQFRLQLMEERSSNELADPRNEDAFFNLCEH